MAVALGAVRVVATPFETFAQYEVRVALDGGPARSAWRRYSAFRAFAEQLAAQCSPIDVARTLTAWGDAEAAKKVFRCVDPHYLVQRYYHFERVLREALFEVDDPQLLLAFFATHPRRTRSAEQLAAQQQRVVRPFARSRPSPSARHDDASSVGSRTPAVRGGPDAVPRHPRLGPPRGAGALTCGALRPPRPRSGNIACMWRSFDSFA